ncbi:unnamed protein product [Ixodes persulcatus]
MLSVQSIAVLVCSVVVITCVGHTRATAAYPGSYVLPRSYLSSPVHQTASPSTQQQYYTSHGGGGGGRKANTMYIIRSLNEGEMLQPESSSLSSGFDAYGGSAVQSAAFPGFGRQFSFGKPFLSGPLMTPWHMVR